MLLNIVIDRNGYADGTRLSDDEYKQLREELQKEVDAAYTIYKQNHNQRHITMEIS